MASKLSIFFAELKRRKVYRVAVVYVVVVGCATAGSGSDSPSEPLSWPGGRYVLEGPGRLYRAELDIGADGSMLLSSSSGLCDDPPPTEMSHDLLQGQRTFHCGEVTYVLKPRGESIRGEIRFSIWETVQRQGPCIDWDREWRVCRAYAYSGYYDQVLTGESVPLRVERKSQSTRIFSSDDSEATSTATDR